ncbi:MAG: Ig-like domain-containing protein, partial [Pseudomonadota bacterium]
MPIRLTLLLFLVLVITACGGGGGSSGGGGTPPPANSVPTASGASYTTTDIASLQGMLVGNDGDGDPLTFAIVTQPTRGTLSDFDAASGAFTYTPDPFENGLDSFTFTV